MSVVTLAALISSLFSRETIQKIMERLPDFKTPAMDFLYPENKRVNNPFPFLTYKDFAIVGNIPLVKRGQQSYKMKSSGEISMLEPQPVYPSIPIDAVDFNNLRMLDSEGQQQYVQNRIDQLRQATKLTAEALCIQSVSGKIQYPMMDGNVKTDFVLDYGTPSAVIASKKLDAADAKTSDLIKLTSAMKEKARKQGFGRDIIFLAPADTYGACYDLVTAGGRDPRFNAEGDLILGNGTVIKQFDYTYVNPDTGASEGLAAKSLTLWDRSAGNRLFYSAVDDIDANFVASPFWPKAVKVEDWYDIKGQSKPTPVPNVKSIIKSVALT